jgi:hypothetical protein
MLQFLITQDVGAQYLTQTVFTSVKNSIDSLMPSRPLPLAFIPPNGMSKQRTIQQFTHTVPTYNSNINQSIIDGCIHGSD